MAATGGCDELRTLYTLGSDLSGFCRNWLEYDDRRVMDTIAARCRGTDAAGLVERLVSRQLPLRVCEVDLKEAGTMFLQAKLAKRDRRAELELRVSQLLGVRSCEVIVDLVETDPPRPSSTEPDIDPEKIYVEAISGPRPFRDVSDIFRENPLSGRKRLAVFAPFEAKRKAERDFERERLSERVREVMRTWGEEA
jgi:hypothetical protein